MFCSDSTLCPLPLCHHMCPQSWHPPNLLDVVCNFWGAMNKCFVVKLISCLAFVNLLLVVMLIKNKCIHFQISLSWSETICLQ